MDIESKVINLSPDTEYTDKYGRRLTVKRTSYQEQAKGYYIYVEGQGYPEFYGTFDPVTIHVPDAKFQPGDSVQARNGKGAIYYINRVFNRDGNLYYEFDNGSVDVRKRARSGWHLADRADKGYKKLSH